MKKSEFEKFLELEKKVTPGPWKHEEAGYFNNMPDIINQPEYLMEWIPNTTEEEGYKKEQVLIDARFIVKSRIIAPAAVRKLMQAMELLRETFTAIYSDDEYLDLLAADNIGAKIKKFLEGYEDA